MKRLKRIMAVAIAAALTTCLLCITQVSSTATTDSRTYVRWVFNPGSDESRYSEYTLPLSSLNANARDTVLFPPDDRYPDVNASIIEFTCVNHNQYHVLHTGGTAFIVGEHLLATAAHCLYSRESQSVSYGFSIKLKEADGSITSVTPAEIHFPLDYKTCADDDKRNYDYGLIYVPNCNLILIPVQTVDQIGG